MPGPQRIPQPGDADFDWSKYQEWRRSTPDPIEQAKATLVHADRFAEAIGLTPTTTATPSPLEAATADSPRVVADPGQRQYTVTSPQGQTITFSGPHGMSRADIVARAKQELAFNQGDIPTTFKAGASKQLLEDDPTTRDLALGIGAASLPLSAPAATAAAVALPFAGTGLDAVSKFLRTGSLHAPSAETLTGDAIEAGLTALGGPAIRAGARGIGMAKDAVASVVPSAVRTVLRGASGLNPKSIAADLATSRPVLRAAEEFGDAISPGNIRRTFSRVLNGLRPGIQEVADDAPLIIDRYSPNVSRSSREIPYRMESPTVAPEPTPLPKSFQALTDDVVDRFMPNTSGYDDAAVTRDIVRPAIERRAATTNASQWFGLNDRRKAMLTLPPETRPMDQVLAGYDRAGLLNDPAVTQASLPRPTIGRSASPIAKPIDVTPAHPSVPTSARMPTDRLKRILASFQNQRPEDATPFDDALLDLILQDPDGTSMFSRGYGRSGQR